MSCAAEAAPNEIGVWMLRSAAASRASNAERYETDAQSQLGTYTTPGAAGTVRPRTSGAGKAKKPRGYACLRPSPAGSTSVRHYSACAAPPQETAFIIASVYRNRVTPG